jgi:hypothetical protein
LVRATLEARAKDNHLVVQPIDFFLVELILSNLHPGAEGPACAQFFDSITDGLTTVIYFGWYPWNVLLLALVVIYRSEQVSHGVAAWHPCVRRPSWPLLAQS